MDPQKYCCSIFSQVKHITKTLIYEFFDTAQVTKLIWCKFSSACSHLVAWAITIISKNAVFAVVLQIFRENLHFHKYQECLFRHHFMSLHHFLTKSSQLLVELFGSEQLWFRKSKSWSGLKQRWSVLTLFMFSESALKNVKFLKQRCLALNLSVTSTGQHSCIGNRRKCNEVEEGAKLKSS